MHSLEHNYLNALNLSTRRLSSFIALGEYRGRQDLFTRQVPETLDTLRQVAMVESTESSNRLEGIIAPHTRIEAIVRKRSQPKNRPEEEIAGYQEALSFIHDSATNIPMTLHTILQLHTMLYRHTDTPGGQWKTEDNEIIELTPEGAIRVRFKPTSAADTPVAMETLIKRYEIARDHVKVDPLVLVPLTILDFLCIHPFQDGNGRMARLLTLLMLYHFDYQAGRYISLERIFEESKQSYYDTLEISSQRWHEGRHDAMPWTSYFCGVLIAAYKEFEERVGTLTEGRGAKTAQVQRAIERHITPFSMSDIERECPGVSRDMIRVIFRQLRDAGKIHVMGRGRSAKWKRSA